MYQQGRWFPHGRRFEFHRVHQQKILASFPETDLIISLLVAVYSTMETISIEGIDNADKFVGCANVVKNVASKLREMNETKEETDG